MINLENFNNMYANLAQSAYNGHPKNFPPKNEKIKNNIQKQKNRFKTQLLKLVSQQIV